MSNEKFPAARRENTGDRVADAIQDRIQRIEQVLNDLPFLRGRFFPGEKFVAYTERTFAHNFGVAANVLPVSPDLDASPGTYHVLMSATQPDPATRVVIYTDVDCTLDLWIWPRRTT